MGCSLLAPGSLVPGLEFEIAHLLGVQRRARPQVALALAQQMPDQDGELAGGRHRRDVLPAPSPHPKEERPQGTRRSRRRPGCLDQHAAGVPPARLVIRPW